MAEKLTPEAEALDRVLGSLFGKPPAQPGTWQQWVNGETERVLQDITEGRLPRDMTEDEIAGEVADRMPARLLRECAGETVLAETERYLATLEN